MILKVLQILKATGYVIQLREKYFLREEEEQFKSSQEGPSQIQDRHLAGPSQSRVHHWQQELEELEMMG
jgi:hypothetical protein